MAGDRDDAQRADEQCEDKPLHTPLTELTVTTSLIGQLGMLLYLLKLETFTQVVLGFWAVYYPP